MKKVRLLNDVQDDSEDFFNLSLERTKKNKKYTKWNLKIKNPLNRPKHD